MPALKDKIIVAISGGVDSSVTALLLKQQGAAVEGLFMKNWDDRDAGGACLWEADVEDAIKVCDRLEIPLNTVDLSSAYRDRVFKHFLADYKNGRTPNPDVLCNQEIKFRAFLDEAERLGAGRIATGHYARIQQQAPALQLLKGRDKNKDQSYFLCRLDQAQLNKALFPLGELEKAVVRQKAAQAGLATFAKKDSTGICFIGAQPFRQFLSRYIPPEPGLIKTTEGKTVGEHQGVFYYTLGQRQGFGVGGVAGAGDSPWYIVRKNIEHRELIVAQDHDHPLLLSRALTAADLHWIAGKAPGRAFRCQAKSRYRQPDQPCALEQIDERHWRVNFDHSQRALTPGQFIVFYEDNICLGGGIIDAVA